MILIKKINEVFVSITGEISHLKEIETKFTFKAPGYRFHPLFKAHKWNGNISLFSIDSGEFYIGILPELIEFLNKSKYEYKVEGDFLKVDITEEDAQQFIKSLNLPITPRDYQVKYFIKMVNNYRGICLSPTNSGKSLIIYLLCRYFNQKTLIIVPFLSLVNQLYEDFKYYGYDSEKNIDKIAGAGNHQSENCIQIADWQSIYKKDKRFFKNYKVVIGDEVHKFKAKSLKSIMEKLTNTPIRVGLTGTLSDEELSNLTIKGLFGPISSYVTQDKLIKDGYSSPINIKMIKLLYPNIDIKMEYKDEIQFILKSKKRQTFIKNLSLKMKGNTFIMFRFKDHGKKLYDAIKLESQIPVFFVDGSTPEEERQEIIKNIETLENSITIASSVFSTGINIKRIHNLILIQPSKSRINTLQTIGRGLRVSEYKSSLTIYDIVDDFQYDNDDNFSLIHAKKRKTMFKFEKFPFKEFIYKF